MHHWEWHGEGGDSLLKYSTLPVLVSRKGIFIFKKKKLTRISKGTFYDFTCKASLDRKTFFTFGGGRFGEYQRRAIQYNIVVKVSKLILGTVGSHLSKHIGTEGC